MWVFYFYKSYDNKNVFKGDGPLSQENGVWESPSEALIPQVFSYYSGGIGRRNLPIFCCMTF